MLNPIKPHFKLNYNFLNLISSTILMDFFFLSIIHNIYIISFISIYGMESNNKFHKLTHEIRNISFTICFLLIIKYFIFPYFAQKKKKKNITKAHTSFNHKHVFVSYPLTSASNTIPRQSYSFKTRML